MKAQEGTFRDLLTQDRQFRVPLYPRHYRWNVDQQRDLWLDIVEQYEAVAESGASTPRHLAAAGPRRTRLPGIGLSTLSQMRK